MAYSVQTASVGHDQGFAASFAPAFGANLHAGGLCFMVFGGRGNSSAGVSSVTDSGSQTWTKSFSIAQASDNTAWLEVWTAPVTAAGTAPTVTVNKNGGGNFGGAFVFEVTGLDTSGTGLDAFGTATIAGNSATATGSATSNSSASGEFVLEVGFANGSNIFTTSSGFASAYAFANPLDVASFYKDSTIGVAETGTINLNSSEFWNWGIGVWKLASGGGGGLVTGWQSEADQLPPRYGSRAAARFFDTQPALALTPSTLPPRVAGMAWFERHDQRDQSKPIFLDVPPAFGQAIASVPNNVTGLGFQGLPSREVLRKQTNIEAGPPAFGRLTVAGIDRNGWLSPRQIEKLPRQIVVDAPPAYGRPIVQLVPISGIAWFAPSDAGVSAKRLPISDPPSIGYARPAVTWSFSAFDVLPTRRAPKDEPPAFGRALTQATVGISGMAWFAPPDRDKPAVKVTIEAPPAIALTPATLPPRISGMAWFEPAPDTTVTRKSFDAPPAFGRQVNAPASTIAGMAWMNPQDAQRAPRAAPLDAAPGVVFSTPSVPAAAWLVVQDSFRPRPRISDAAPTAVFYASPVPVGAWLVQQDSFRPRLRVSDAQPAAVFTPSPLSIGGWFNEPDVMFSRKGARDTAPAQILRSIIPPVGVSGIAWFEPRDDKPRAHLGVDWPPAFGYPYAQNILQGSLVCAAISINPVIGGLPSGLPAVAGSASGFSAVTGDASAFPAAAGTIDVEECEV